MSILTPNTFLRGARLASLLTVGVLTAFARDTALVTNVVTNVVTNGVTLGTAVVSAQSLGDVAKQEDARRKAVTSKGKVYSNDGLRPEPAPRTAPTPSPSPTAPSSASGTSGAAPPASTPAGTSGAPEAGALVADGKRDEQYWRERMKTLREATRRSRVFADALQSRINGLTADFTARHDPIQRAAIAADRESALAELDRVKKEILQQDRALADAQEEARRSGTPAGWLRE